MKLVNEIILTKCEIMDSLIKEPYSPGRWTNYDGEGEENDTLAQANACGTAFCAITNIMRDHVDPECTVQDFVLTCQRASAKDVNRPHGTNLFPKMMRAFDATFSSYESDYRAPPMKRLQFLKWVDEVFPEQVRIRTERAVLIARDG